jgi:hypothetical protein
MALPLLYLIFCQLTSWLALLARGQASKNAELRPGSGLHARRIGPAADADLPPRPGATKADLVRRASAGAKTERNRARRVA